MSIGIDIALWTTRAQNILVHKMVSASFLQLQDLQDQHDWQTVFDCELWDLESIECKYHSYGSLFVIKKL